MNHRRGRPTRHPKRAMMNGDQALGNSKSKREWWVYGRVDEIATRSERIREAMADGDGVEPSQE